MKLLSLGLASLGLASAASVAAPVNYDGWKVYRVNVGDKNAEFSKIVSDIGLATWKGRVETSKVVDVMVSPSQLDAFEKAAESLETQLMHDNLGESIAAEADFPVYAGNLSPQPILHLNKALMAIQPRQTAMSRSMRLQTLHGLMRTIPLTTIRNF